MIIQRRTFPQDQSQIAKYAPSSGEIYVISNQFSSNFLAPPLFRPMLAQIQQGSIPLRIVELQQGGFQWWHKLGRIFFLQSLWVWFHRSRGLMEQQQNQVEVVPFYFIIILEISLRKKEKKEKKKR